MGKSTEDNDNSRKGRQVHAWTKFFRILLQFLQRIIMQDKKGHYRISTLIVPNTRK